MKATDRQVNLLVVAATGLIALLFPLHALAATAPPLGLATFFGVLGGQTVTSTGLTIVVGELGVSPGTSITGFPPGIVVGTIHSADAVAAEAQADLTTAYENLAGQACDASVSGDLGGQTFFPGVYCASSSLGLTGTVTLDAQNDPNAVFVFQVGSTLTTASGSRVNVINGGRSCNVFWQIGSSATLGTGSTFVGNILALASVTVTTGATVDGRTLARNAAVTLDSALVSVCSLDAPVPSIPALGKAFNLSTIDEGGISTLTITLSNPNVAVATLTAPLIDSLPAGVVVAPVPNVGTTCDGVGSPVAIAGTTTVTLPAGRSIPANGSCTVTVDVTAAVGGVYLNVLLPGALMTSNGNNPRPAAATLTVIPPGTTEPTLGKAFSPSTINAGGVSTLTITLGNPDAVVATLSEPLIDSLPGGVVVAPTPNVSTTCGGVGAPVAVAGSTTVTLPAGRSIPASGTCTITVDVTAAVGGSYINTLPVGALVTSTGSNPAPAIATLTVVPPIAAASIPTLSEWTMIALAAFLALFGMARIRRRAI